MPFPFTCPHCGYQNLIAEQFIGRTGPCATCGKEVTIEPPAAATSPRPAAPRNGGVVKMLLISLASIVGIVLLLGGVIGVVYLAVANSDAVGTFDDQSCIANLEAIGSAMLQYHTAHGRFPPAVVYDSQGRPIHSWRVLLLPYLGHSSLFAQYNMNAPWDDPQNQTLSWQMPAVYHCPQGLNVAGSETSYMVVTGAGTVFPSAESASVLDILDGPKETLLVVETTGMAINWLEPRDLAIGSLPLTIDATGSSGIGSEHRSGETHVLMADGKTVRHLSNLTSPEELESMLTIDAADTPAK